MILWCKFFDYLKLNKSLGLILKIIGLMVKELLSFLAIFLIDILAFASIFYYLFFSDYD